MVDIKTVVEKMRKSNIDIELFEEDGKEKVRIYDTILDIDKIGENFKFVMEDGTKIDWGYFAPIDIFQRKYFTRVVQELREMGFVVPSFVHVGRHWLRQKINVDYNGMYAFVRVLFVGKSLHLVATYLWSYEGIDLWNVMVLKEASPMEEEKLEEIKYFWNAVEGLKEVLE